ncbi:MAG TPA: M48 family metalloprotease [Microthrixaceae bacterium]|nr:M48 family metalloprotease [Microthrixaceae bacterium]
MTATTPTLVERAPEHRRLAGRLAIHGGIRAGIAAAVIVLLLVGLLVNWVLAAIVAVVAGVAAGVGYSMLVRAAAVPGLLRFLQVQTADPLEHARYRNLVEGLCITSGIDEPELFVVDEERPNVMVLGQPGEAAIVVTTGLLSTLNRVELEGVIAEALARIRSFEAHLGSQAAAFVCGSLLRNGPVIAGRPMWMVAPLSGWRSRRLRHVLDADRHLLADFAAVALTRYPPGLRDALVKMQDVGTVVTDCPWGAAHLWMCDPLADVAEGTTEARLNREFRTHPPIQHRIELLDQL